MLPLRKKEIKVKTHFPLSEKGRCFQEIKGTDIATLSEMTFETPSLPLGFSWSSMGAGGGHEMEWPDLFKGATIS